MSEVHHHQLEITDAESGLRLDQALARRLSAYSRSVLKGWIDAGQVTVNAQPCRPRDTVYAGDAVAVQATLQPDETLAPQPVAFSVVHEDAACIVVDKPAGCVVHPGAGNADATLANGLVHRFPELAVLPRAGLIHRLDKETTGLLIVARTSAAYQQLVRAMAAREIERTYAAIVNGRIIAGGSIDRPIGRDPANRTRMAVRDGGREAITHYRVVGRYRSHTGLDVRLETGRTHQIRVHMASIGHPLVGDVRYGGRVVLPHAPHPVLDDCVRAFRRPALHARALAFRHPTDGGTVRCESPLPADFAMLRDACATDADAG